MKDANVVETWLLITGDQPHMGQSWQNLQHDKNTNARQHTLKTLAIRDEMLDNKVLACRSSKPASTVCFPLSVKDVNTFFVMRPVETKETRVGLVKNFWESCEPDCLINRYGGKRLKHSQQLPTTTWCGENVPEEVTAKLIPNSHLQRIAAKNSRIFAMMFTSKPNKTKIWPLRK